MRQFIFKIDKSGVFDHVPVNIKITEHRLMQDRMMRDYLTEEQLWSSKYFGKFKDQIL